MKRGAFFAIIFLLLFEVCFAELSTFDDGATIYDSSNALVWTPYTLQPRNYALATSFASTFNLASRSNWRLPTLTELESIADNSKTPKTDSLFNLGAPRKWSVWSSTTYTAPRSVFSSRYYILSFANGKSTTVPSNSSYAFLLVSEAATGFPYILPMILE